MAQKLTYICDRCGIEITDTTKDLYAVRFSHYDPDDYIIDSYDLCHTCWGASKRFAITPRIPFERLTT